MIWIPKRPHPVAFLILFIAFILIFYGGITGKERLYFSGAIMALVSPLFGLLRT